MILDPTNPDLTDVIGVAFLDKYGRFVKVEEELITVRFFYDPDLSSPSSADLTRAQWLALPAAKRLEITDAPSGAGFVDTEHKSNA